MLTKKSGSYLAKELGLALNYVVLIVGLYAWDLKPFIVIISFMCEYGAVVLIAATLSLWVAESRLIRIMSALELLIGGFALLGMQAVPIFIIIKLHPYSSGWLENINYGWVIPAMIIPMLIFYVLPLRSVPGAHERLDMMRSKLFTIAVGFLLMGFIGLLVMECTDTYDMRVVMVTMIVSRLVLEIYMNYVQRDEPKKKPAKD